MNKGYAVRWLPEEETWEVHDLVLALTPRQMAAVGRYIERVTLDRARALPPGPRKDEAKRIAALARAGNIRQRMRSGSGDRVLVDLPMPASAKTPFSDLGSIVGARLVRKSTGAVLVTPPLRTPGA